MEIDEHIVAPGLLFPGEVAALYCEVAGVLHLEVLSRVGKALHDEGFGAEVAELVEVARGADDDLGYFV